MTLAKARIVNYDRQSDAPNCSVTYDRHYDDRNSFIIQATVLFYIKFGHSNYRIAPPTCQFKIVKVNFSMFKTF